MRRVVYHAIWEVVTMSAIIYGVMGLADHNDNLVHKVLSGVILIYALNMRYWRS